MSAARRGFLKALAVAPLVPGTLVEVPPPTVPPPPPAAASLPASASTSLTDAVAEALAEAVKREHGASLDAEELGTVRKEIARGLDSAARLRKAARLGNGDAPVTTFSAAPPEAVVARRARR